MARPSRFLLLLLTAVPLFAATASATEAKQKANRRLTREEAIALGAGGNFGMQDYTPDPELAGVDMSRLTAEQKLRAMKLFHSEHCNCGCGMTLYRCRKDDPTCGSSKPLAQGIVDKIAAGKTDAEITSVGLEPAAVRLVEEVRHEFDLTGAPTKGPAGAKVTVVEFADFECELCALTQTWLPKVLEIYPKDVRLVFQHFPLQHHNKAVLAAEASMAAHAQGKFWPLHDKIYADINNVSKSSILKWAQEVGIDMAVFNKSLEESKYLAGVLADAKEARAAGAIGTPTFYINGHRLLELPTYESLRDAIEEALAKP